MTRPARGTRPANRRALVLDGAEKLFHRHGYSNVSMKDVADEVAVGPSALYRHVQNKQDLLEAVIADALTAVRQQLELAEQRRTDDLAAMLADVMVERRAIGVLWHREARHLDDDARQNLRNQLRDINGRLADILRHDRADLTGPQAEFLGWAMLAVATSVSFHTLDVAPATLADLLRHTAATTIPALDSTSDVATPPTWTYSRREEILSAATRLFAAQGFAEVGLDSIGAEVGITGASIYNHFDNKAAILSAAVMRGNDLLNADMYRQLARSTSPRDALRRLARSYREFAFENIDSIHLLTSDIDQLTANDRHRARVAQHDYIDTWMQILRQSRPNVDDVEARMRVQAALNVVNDLATTTSTRQWANAGTAVDAVCHTLLS